MITFRGLFTIITEDFNIANIELVAHWPKNSYPMSFSKNTERTNLLFNCPSRTDYIKILFISALLVLPIYPFLYDKDLYVIRHSLESAELGCRYVKLLLCWPGIGHTFLVLLT